MAECYFSSFLRRFRLVYFGIWSVVVDSSAIVFADWLVVVACSDGWFSVIFSFGGCCVVVSSVFWFAEFVGGGVFTVSFVSWDNLDRFDGDIMGGGVFVVGSIFVSDSYSNTCSSIYSLSSIISNSPHIVTFAPIRAFDVLACKYWRCDWWYTMIVFLNWEPVLLTYWVAETSKTVVLLFEWGLVTMVPKARSHVALVGRDDFVEFMTCSLYICSYNGVGN